jgi:hypothetical protein
MRRRDPKTHKSEDDPGDVFDAMASILTPFDETQYWYDFRFRKTSHFRLASVGK